ncbi:PQQ-binding-like beta-propeller repeat protein, partial [Roseomonas hellenica]|nr:PQQ-binding-like beta-propeller repeat protein [Plastoroseomonas hellenica]
MHVVRPSRGPLVLAILLALLGIGIGGGGAWLIALGGSWFYAGLGIAMLVTAGLLWRRSPAALWVYALATVATLAWAVWEAGLDWWPLAARGDIVFVLGALLLLPWVTRGLGAARGGRFALAGVLLLALVVGGLALSREPHRIDGALPMARGAAGAAPAATGAPPVPEGEWHAYGRTGFGQRYSPLAQITPENVQRLQVAWHFRTGDVRGRPGDPEETTFQVTPLKIGDRLFLCTPHQSVIALDAESGREVWRYEPRIQSALALQHLTCRGLSYHDGPAYGAPSGAPTPP